MDIQNCALVPGLGHNWGRCGPGEQKILRIILVVLRVVKGSPGRGVLRSRTVSRRGGMIKEGSHPYDGREDRQG